MDSAGFISQKGVGATRCIDKRKYFKYGSIEDGDIFVIRLFVIRTAGQIIDSAVLGSIEYVAVELGIPLIFVMGHEKCQPATLQPCNPATARRFEI